MHKVKNMKNSTLAILFYLLLYLLLFFFALNFNYVEGDDAATVLYHLCGRNPEIQQPYAAYNSGMDFLLEHSGLTSEPGLRIFAVAVSFVSGLLILVFSVLLLELLFEKSEMTGARSRLYFYLVLPFLIPDVFFHSLIVNPSNISFALLLVSLLFYIRFLKGKHRKDLILAMALFAVSVPFRWTMLIALPLYAGFFLYFYPLANYPKQTWLLAGKIALANAAGVLLSIVLIGISGYDPDRIRKTIASTANYLEKSDVSVLGMLASGTAFLTPGLLLLVFFALLRIYALHKSGKSVSVRIFGLLLLSVSPFFLFGFYPLYKYSMTFLPALFVLLLLGFDYLRYQKVLRGIFVAAVFLPWLIGIEIDASGTFCGPGFELNMNKIVAQGQNVKGENPDNRIKIKKVRPVFASGFYMPMPEGPRPLYGYFYALFGGQWKEQIAVFTHERDQLYAFLEKNPGATYFEEGKFYFLCDLYRHGFRTGTGYLRSDQGNYRVFKKGTRSIVVREVPSESKAAWIAQYMKHAPNPVVFRSSYSNDILKLKTSNTGNITFLGPFTAIKQQ